MPPPGGGMCIPPGGAMCIPPPHAPGPEPPCIIVPLRRGRAGDGQRGDGRDISQHAHRTNLPCVPGRRAAAWIALRFLNIGVANQLHRRCAGDVPFRASP